ncbi:hypothetical protein AAVH_34381, partial [Aphelenchoides avenae]
TCSLRALRSILPTPLARGQISGSTCCAAHPVVQAVSLTFGDVDSHCRRRSIFYTDYVNVTVFEYTPSVGISHAGDLHIEGRQRLERAKPALRIARRLGGHKKEGDFEYEINCAKRRDNPPVWIHIGSKTPKLIAKDCILKISDDSAKNSATPYTCYLAFQSRLFDLDVGDTWYVGTPLFNSNCLALDFGRKRIGFATPKKLVLSNAASEHTQFSVLTLRPPFCRLSYTTLNLLLK